MIFFIRTWRFSCLYTSLVRIIKHNGINSSSHSGPLGGETKHTHPLFICASGSTSAFSLDKACQLQAFTSTTRLRHVKWHQPRRMLSRVQTLNNQTVTLNMQEKPLSEWQQKLRRSIHASPAVNRGASSKQCMRFIFLGFAKLSDVWLLRAHWKNLFRRRTFQSNSQNMSAGNMRFGFEGAGLIMLMGTFRLIAFFWQRACCMRKHEIFFNSAVLVSQKHSCAKCPIIFLAVGHCVALSVLFFHPSDLSLWCWKWHLMVLMAYIKSFWTQMVLKLLLRLTRPT